MTTVADGSRATSDDVVFCEATTGDDVLHDDVDSVGMIVTDESTLG